MAQYERERSFINKILRLLGCLCDKLEFDKKMNQHHLNQAVELSQLYISEVFYTKEKELSELYSESGASVDKNNYLISLVTERGKMRSYLKKIEEFELYQRSPSQSGLLELASNIRNYILSTLKYLYIMDRHYPDKHKKGRKNAASSYQKHKGAPVSSSEEPPCQSTMINTFNDLQKIYRS